MKIKRVQKKNPNVHTNIANTKIQMCQEIIYKDSFFSANRACSAEQVLRISMRAKSRFIYEIWLLLSNNTMIMEVKCGKILLN